MMFIPMCLRAYVFSSIRASDGLNVWRILIAQLTRIFYITQSLIVYMPAQRSASDIRMNILHRKKYALRLLHMYTQHTTSQVILQLDTACHQINIDYIEIRLIKQVLCRCWAEQPFEPSAYIRLNVWPRMGAKVGEIPGQEGALIRAKRRMANARIWCHDAIFQTRRRKCATKITADKVFGGRRCTRG